MAFGVDDALAIAGIVATLASIGTAVGGAAAGEKAKSKQEDYQEKMETIRGIEDEGAQQEERKRALGKLVGGSAVNAIPRTTMSPQGAAPAPGTAEGTLKGTSGALAGTANLAGNLSGQDWQNRFAKWRTK